MQLVLNEDQELLAKTAADFVAERSPVARMRALRDSGDELGFSRELWREMASLGWVGIPFSEADGGAEMGMAELAIVLEALGRNLAPEPFLSTVLLGGQALALAGSEEQKSAWLSGVVEGEKILSLATQEAGSRYDPCRISTRAERSGDGYRITGRKEQVLDGASADLVVVPVRSAGEEGDREGITLLLVDGAAKGLRREPQSRVDGRAAAILHFDAVEVPASALLGAEGDGASLLEKVIDRATVGLCAEMLGGMCAVFEATVAHLKEREQFGVRIGSFQGLKHRAARVFIELELARSCTMAAARTIDENPETAAARVSLAKARCNDAYMLAANEAVQMFGGVGMTDEYDIGFYLKRARAASLSFGNSAWHRDRFARLRNY